MEIKIVGAKCISCKYFTQFYEKTFQGYYERIDCGFCGRKQRKVRPGDRCKEYGEKGNCGRLDY
ncbi:MAG: hypothetical protein J6C37_06070 [Roseburia sp.]|nr:hypothetical protein [Roseburia sp.]